MVAFRCGLTAHSRLCIALVWEHGYLVELCGLSRSKLLQSAHLCGRGSDIGCRPPTKLPRHCRRHRELE